MDEQEIFGYVDAVDNKTVYVAPARKRWLDPQQDKEWKQFHYDHQYDTPLYTTPPSKPWVSLTDEEIDYIWGVTPPDYENFFEFPRAIETALRSKNNG